MIDRLPLEIFGGESEPDSDANPASPTPAVEADAVIEPAGNDEESPADPARCQFCGEEFSSELDDCPHCGSAHLRSDDVEVEATIVTCQWCQTEFARDLVRCPNCDAMALIPGQVVPGENDPMPLFVSHGMLGRRAQSHQLLVGMMAGGGLDTIAAGLIGLALTLFDDD